MTRIHLRQGLLAVWAITFPGVAGCVGTVDEGGAAAGRVDDSDPTMPEPPVVAGCEQTSPDHVVVHRLNRVEYNNTIRDLLGDDSRPADEFLLDDSDGTFDNNSRLLNLNSQDLSQLSGVAQRLAQKAVATAGFVTCDPATVGDTTCARKVLEPFLLRAWRRPPVDAEFDGLIKFVQLAKDNQATFNDGLALAVQTALVSPHFLYRFEYPPPGPQSPGPHLLDAYAIASRLSYFLWSSMPDPRLLQAAQSGALLKEDGLITELKRMLADPKAAALADNLAGQWLGGRKVVSAAPDPRKFPRFDAVLRESIQSEPSLFLNAFFQENRDLRDLLDADFTFVNKRLADHYGIKDPGLTDTAFKRIDLTGNTQRGGILTHAALLILTSKPDQPNIPKRGKWALLNLMCSPPADPPPDFLMKQAELDAALGPNATRRQVAEKRANTPGCNACHGFLDPIGLGLDAFDATGAWRTMDGRQPISVSGLKLPDGTTFSGPRHLERILKQSEGLPECITTTLFRYAMGRNTQTGDQCLLADIRKQAAQSGFQSQELIAALVKSPLFRSQSESRSQP